MSYINGIKFQVFSLIIFFVLLIIIVPDFCYAQYPESLFEGYAGYPSWNYPSQNTLLRTYITPGRIMNYYSSTVGYGNIYMGLSNLGMISYANMTNPFSVISGSVILPENLSVLGTNMINPSLMIGGLFPLPGNSGGFVLMNGLNAFDGSYSNGVGNLGEQNDLSEYGSLAGLVSLGSSSGLIYTSAMMGNTILLGF